MHRLEYEALCRMHKQKRAMKGRRTNPRTGRTTVELSSNASGRYGGAYRGWDTDGLARYGKARSVG